MNNITVDDFIKISNVYVKYSNLIKNSGRKESNGTFFIKGFKNNRGEGSFGYYVSYDSVFRTIDVLKYVIEFNPEKLI